LTRKKHSLEIKECRETQETEFDSYYQTVIMSVGLKHIFSEEEPCTFKINEPSMHTHTNVVTPDAIFQCDNDTKGIVCEIKTSLPASEDYLFKDMKEQIEKYSDIQKGWKTSSEKIPEHSILLFVHRTDSKKLDSMLKKWIGEGKIKTDRKICVADWQSIKPFKVGARDTTLLSHRSGTTGCDYFDSKLKEDIEIFTDDVFMEYETRKFVKSPPPDLYIMTILYQHVFPTFANENDEFTVSIDELMKTLTEYYTSWSGLEGEQSQIRRRWIIKAMDKFCEIKIAEKISEESHNYRIKWAKRVPKDYKSYLLDKLCGKEEAFIDDSKQTKLTEI